VQVNVYGVNPGDHPDEDKLADKPVPGDIKRRQRAIMNDLENIPTDLVVFWAALVVVFIGSVGGRCSEEALALTVLLPVYTSGRFLHTTFYLISLQPFRSLSFFLGFLAVLSAGGVLVSAGSKVLTL
jgi:uncharacterized MAPEG superfamily protein